MFHPLPFSFIPFNPIFVVYLFLPFDPLGCLKSPFTSSLLSFCSCRCRLLLGGLGLQGVLGHSRWCKLKPRLVLFLLLRCIYSNMMQFFVFPVATKRSSSIATELSPSVASDIGVVACWIYSSRWDEAQWFFPSCILKSALFRSRWGRTEITWDICRRL